MFTCIQSSFMVSCMFYTTSICQYPLTCGFLFACILEFHRTHTLCPLSTVNTLYLYSDIVGLHSLQLHVGIPQWVLCIHCRLDKAWLTIIHFFKTPWLSPVLLIECFRISFPGWISRHSEQCFGSWTRWAIEQWVTTMGYFQVIIKASNRQFLATYTYIHCNRCNQTYNPWCCRVEIWN